jgi:hypothetical protein
MNTFSKRHGFSLSDEVEITIREEAPHGLRDFIITVADDDCKLSPFTLRAIICRILKETPDPNKLLPASEQQPEIANAIQQHNERLNRKLVWLIGAATSEAAIQQALQLEQKLQHSKLFNTIMLV